MIPMNKPIDRTLSDRIVQGKNKENGQIETLSTRCTLKEIVEYLEQEWTLSKEYPQVKKGLYGEYDAIKIVFAPLKG